MELYGFLPKNDFQTPNLAEKEINRLLDRGKDGACSERSFGLFLFLLTSLA